ncbi:MAG: hypothetical protein ACYCTH_00465 [Cellulomonas sp.]
MAAVTTRPRRRRTRVARTLVWLSALLVVAVVAVVLALNRTQVLPLAQVRCAATADGTSWYLTPEQADNAALIVGISMQRGLPAHAATIAIATALQESKLVNVTHGDRDSLGLFQQRPSQGWGTAAQVVDPVHATNAFYDALIAVPGYATMAVTAAAQAVQRSAFPEAYAQHEPQARAWASALTGYSTTAVTCHLRAPDAAGSAASFAAHVRRDLGPLAVTPGSATPAGLPIVVTTATGVPADVRTRQAWSTAEGVVAIAQAEQVTVVTVADQEWTRARGTWQASGTTVPTGEVHVTLAVG